MGYFKLTETLKEGYRVIKEFPLIMVPALFASLSSLIPNLQFIPSNPFVFYPFWFLFSLIGVFFSSWILKLVYDQKKGKADLKKAAKHIFKRYPTLIGSWVLFSFARFFGLIALVLPGIFIWIRLILFKQTIVIDDKGVVESLEESWRLVKGNWWALFYLFLTLFLPSLLIKYLGFFLTYLDLPVFYSQLVGAASDVFFIPWRISTFTLAYIKIKE